MKVNINGQSYLISFPEVQQQFSSNQQEKIAQVISSPASRTILCNIRTEQTKQVVVSRIAACSLKQQFVRIVGEKIALTRALASLNLTKDQRREVWITYFKSSTKRRKVHATVISKLETPQTA